MDNEYAAQALGQKRVLFLVGEITVPSAAHLTQELVALSIADPHLPITVFINSSGGDLVQALGICDLMASLPAPIQTIVVGWALSAAALIAACGTKGMRLVYPSARYLMHQARERHNGEIFILPDDKARVQFQESLQVQAFAMFAVATGKPHHEIARRSQWDRYLTAQEAIQFGLADALIQRLTVSGRLPKPRPRKS